MSANDSFIVSVNMHMCVCACVSVCLCVLLTLPNIVVCRDSIRDSGVKMGLFGGEVGSLPTGPVVCLALWESVTDTGSMWQCILRDMSQVIPRSNRNTFLLMCQTNRSQGGEVECLDLGV